MPSGFSPRSARQGILKERVCHPSFNKRELCEFSRDEWHSIMRNSWVTGQDGLLIGLIVPLKQLFLSYREFLTLRFRLRLILLKHPLIEST